MGDLRTYAGLSSPTVTRIVDKLVTSSLAFRETGPTDRRRVTLHASKHGVQTHLESKLLIDSTEQNLGL